MFYVIIMGHRVCEQEKKVCIKHKYHNKTVPMLYIFRMVLTTAVS